MVTDEFKEMRDICGNRVSSIIGILNQRLGLSLTRDEQSGAYYHVFGDNETPDVEGWRKALGIACRLQNILSLSITPSRKSRDGVGSDFASVSSIENGELQIDNKAYGNVLILWPEKWPENWKRRLSEHPRFMAEMKAIVDGTLRRGLDWINSFLGCRIRVNP